MRSIFAKTVTRFTLFSLFFTHKNMSDDDSQLPSDEEVLAVLGHFEWNYHLAADFLNCDPADLKIRYESKHPNPDLPQTSAATFNGAHINSSSLARLQRFVNKHLKSPFPLLFDNSLSDAEKSAIASEILLEKGLPYRLTHLKEYQVTYEVLEKEALSLAQWRELIEYLTLVEETLFKISARLSHKDDSNAEEEVNLADE